MAKKVHKLTAQELWLQAKICLEKDGYYAIVQPEHVVILVQVLNKLGITNLTVVPEIIELAKQITDKEYDTMEYLEDDMTALLEKAGINFYKSISEDKPGS